MSTKSGPPRLYGMLATGAPVAVIFRRGPSAWWHVLRWRLDEGRLEPGVWVKKKLYPQRCDLSADGELLLYFVGGGFGGEWKVFVGVSRCPWLHPLADWEEDISTWSWGNCFVKAGGAMHVMEEAKQIKLPGRYVRVQMNDRVAFVNERRRGWVEAKDCSPRHPQDVYDEHRRVVLEKACEVNGCVLRLADEGHEAWIREGVGPSKGIEGCAPRFELVYASGRGETLNGVTWAEWDQRGRLLTATKDGRLIAEEIRDGARVVVEEHDLNGMAPDPRPAPTWAHGVKLARE